MLDREGEVRYFYTLIVCVNCNWEIDITILGILGESEYFLQKTFRGYDTIPYTDFIFELNVTLNEKKTEQTSRELRHET